MLRMSSLLPFLVTAVAGAAITAVAVRRVAADGRWRNWQTRTVASVVSVRGSGGEPLFLAGWPILAAGLLLVSNFASDDTASTQGAWTGVAWLAVPLALACLPATADESPPGDAA
ncbi:hypothetical protein [Planctellipticum variicoloris]|uniref:hypothetical protein n=1 Tax=Planctellipticum variicoloris TaxID=3064265 RepID=UPI003013B9F9